MVEYPESLANAINAFESLFELGVVPVVNENDAVSVDEMDHATKFGDNDRLSAIVAKMLVRTYLSCCQILMGSLIRTQMSMRTQPFVAMYQRLPRNFSLSWWCW